MKLLGKYTVEIKNNGKLIKKIETKNMLVDNGIRQVVDWLSSSLFSDNSFPMLRKIGKDELFFLPNETTSATSLYYADSSIDYSDYDKSNVFYDKENNIDNSFIDFNNFILTDNTYATIDQIREGKQSISIGFTNGACLVAALNVDAEMMAYNNENNNEEISFGIEYRGINDITWKDIPCNYTIPCDGKRHNLTFFVCPNIPPFVFLPTTGLKFYFNVKPNSLSKTNTLVGKIYNVSIFEPNFYPQPPMVMKVGSGTSEVNSSQTNLENFQYSQVISYIRKNNNTVSYIIEIPRDQILNDISEIGMFYRYDNVNPTHQHIKQTVKNANTMFSRAIFKNDDGTIEPWTKEKDQEVSISYDLTVENN